MSWPAGATLWRRSTCSISATAGCSGSTGHGRSRGVRPRRHSSPTARPGSRSSISPTSRPRRASPARCSRPASSGPACSPGTTAAPSTTSRHGRMLTRTDWVRRALRRGLSSRRCWRPSTSGSARPSRSAGCPGLGEFWPVGRWPNSVGWVHYVPGMYQELDLPDAMALAAPRALMVMQNRDDLLFSPGGMERAVARIAAAYAKAGVADAVSRADRRRAARVQPGDAGGRVRLPGRPAVGRRSAR